MFRLSLQLLSVNSQYEENEVFLNHEAIALLMRHGNYDKLEDTYVLAGPEDLRALLPKLSLSEPGKEAFILIRPYIHCMVLYLNNIEGTIHALLFDPQNWGQRYYPSRLILDALSQHLPSNSKILETNIDVQSQDENRGCAQYSIAFINHCKQKGTALFLEQEENIIFSLQCFEANEHSVKVMLGKQLNKLEEILTYEYTNNEGELDQSKILETVMEMQGCFLDRNSAYLARPSLYPIHIDLEANKVEITLRHKDAIYGNGLVFSDAIYPLQLKDKSCHSRVLLEGVNNIEVSYNPTNQTVCLSATNADILRELPEILLHNMHVSYASHMRQLGMLSTLAHEIGDALELLQIKRDDNTGGVDQHQVQLALQWNFKDKNDIWIPTTEQLCTDSSFPSLNVLYKSGYKYIAFSLDNGDAHQVGIWIELNDEEHTISILDADNYNATNQLRKTLSILLGVEDTELKIETYDEQHDNWSCGIRVYEYISSKYDNRDADISNLETLLESFYVAYKQQLLLPPVFEEKVCDPIPETALPILNSLETDLNLTLVTMKAKERFLHEVIAILHNNSLEDFILKVGGDGRWYLESIQAKGLSTNHASIYLYNKAVDRLKNHNSYAQARARGQKLIQAVMQAEFSERYEIVKKISAQWNFIPHYDKWYEQIASNNGSFLFFNNKIDQQFRDACASEEEFFNFLEVQLPQFTHLGFSTLHRLPAGLHEQYLRLEFEARFNDDDDDDSEEFELNVLREILGELDKDLRVLFVQLFYEKFFSASWEDYLEADKVPTLLDLGQHLRGILDLLPQHIHAFFVNSLGYRHQMAIFCDFFINCEADEIDNIWGSASQRSDTFKQMILCNLFAHVVIEYKQKNQETLKKMEAFLSSYSSNMFCVFKSGGRFTVVIYDGLYERDIFDYFAQIPTITYEEKGEFSFLYLISSPNYLPNISQEVMEVVKTVIPEHDIEALNRFSLRSVQQEIREKTRQFGCIFSYNNIENWAIKYTDYFVDNLFNYYPQLKFAIDVNEENIFKQSIASRNNTAAKALWKKGGALNSLPAFFYGLGECKHSRSYGVCFDAEMDQSLVWLLKEAINHGLEENLLRCFSHSFVDYYTSLCKKNDEFQLLWDTMKKHNMLDFFTPPLFERITEYNELISNHALELAVNDKQLETILTSSRTIDYLFYGKKINHIEYLNKLIAADFENRDQFWKNYFKRVFSMLFLGSGWGREWLFNKVMQLGVLEEILDLHLHKILYWLTRHDDKHQTLQLVSILKRLQVDVTPYAVKCIETHILNNRLPGAEGCWQILQRFQLVPADVDIPVTIWSYFTSEYQIKKFVYFRDIFFDDFGHRIYGPEIQCSFFAKALENKKPETILTCMIHGVMFNALKKGNQLLPKLLWDNFPFEEKITFIELGLKYRHPLGPVSSKAFDNVIFSSQIKGHLKIAELLSKPNEPEVAYELREELAKLKHDYHQLIKILSSCCHLDMGLFENRVQIYKQGIRQTENILFSKGQPIDDNNDAYTPRISKRGRRPNDDIFSSSFVINDSLFSRTVWFDSTLAEKGEWFANSLLNGFLLTHIPLWYSEQFELISQGSNVNIENYATLVNKTFNSFSDLLSIKMEGVSDLLQNITQLLIQFAFQQRGKTSDYFSYYSQYQHPVYKLKPVMNSTVQSIDCEPNSKRICINQR